MISSISNLDLVEQARLLSAKLFRLYEFEVLYQPVNIRTQKIWLAYKRAHTRYRRRQILVIKK